jgi:hypothetical protein
MQHLEKIGEHAKAVEHYEASGCGPVEVTRMYFQAGMVEELEQYINKQVGAVRGASAWLLEEPRSADFTQSSALEHSLQHFNRVL